MAAFPASLGRSIPARAGEPCRRGRGPTSPGVHPRACGGARRRRRFRLEVEGPSPRVRGSHWRACRQPTMSGSIPARAGEPPSDTCAPRPIRVHPRACGGADNATSIRRSERGPSPRVRGSRAFDAATRDALRSIPARAGEPLSAAATAFVRAVHPRACGGAAPPRRQRPRTTGPSPRVRGSLNVTRVGETDDRSIPARAGEPRSTWCITLAHGVHPRACGGANGDRRMPSSWLGPSPRVRGSRLPNRHEDRGQGSIPARAGEPPCTSWRKIIPTVHPRACGGATTVKRCSRTATGPSPRVRGSQLESVSLTRPTGSIPARAGEPQTGHSQADPHRVHPRACGGALPSRQGCRLGHGPSPRVRGSLQLVDASEDRHGSIPARAGEPLCGYVTEGRPRRYRLCRSASRSSERHR